MARKNLSLDDAFRLEKERQDRHRADLEELSSFKEQGARQARLMRNAGLGLAALGFLAISILMLANPGSARAWLVLLLTIGLAGAWRYFQRSK